MKSILKYLIILLPFTTFAQEKNCTINVKIDGVPLNGKAFITIGDYRDSINLTDGRIIFKEELAYPILAKLDINYERIKRDYSEVLLYLNKGQTNITLNPPDSAFKIKVTGEKLGVDFWEKLWAPVREYNNAIGNIQFHLMKERSKTPADTVAIKNYTEQLNVTVIKCFTVPQVYIKANPGSPLSLLAINMLGNGTKDTPLTVQNLSDLYDSLSQAIKNSPDGLKYAQKLENLKSNTN